MSKQQMSYTKKKDNSWEIELIERYINLGVLESLTVSTSQDRLVLSKLLVFKTIY